MYSLNQDYLKLSDFLRNNRKEDVICPGLKPFNPTGTTVLAPENPEPVVIREVHIIQFVPVPVLPVDEERIVAMWPLEEENLTGRPTTEDKSLEHYRNGELDFLANGKHSVAHQQKSRKWKTNDNIVRGISRGRKQNGCGFCRRNGERAAFFYSHSLKDLHGNVECPILRNYTCPQCQATGDYAHTVAYCPMGRDKAPITSIKSTRKSCGCKWSDKHCHCT